GRPCLRRQAGTGKKVGEFARAMGGLDSFTRPAVSRQGLWLVRQHDFWNDHIQHQVFRHKCSAVIQRLAFFDARYEPAQPGRAQIFKARLVNPGELEPRRLVESEVVQLVRVPETYEPQG